MSTASSTSGARTAGTGTGTGTGGPGRNNNHRNGRAKTKWTKNKSKTTFTGKTTEMNGQVFQLQAEQRKKGQFQETLDQLWIYSSSIYKKDIKHLKILFTQLEQPQLPKPELSSQPSTSDEAIFKEEIRQYIKDRKSLETTLASLYNVVWGQCSKLLQNKLKSSKHYSNFDNNSDVAALLKEIKTLSNKIEENTSIYDSLHEAKVKFYRYQQADDDTLADHMRNFKDLCQTIEYHGGDIFFDKDMIEYEVEDDTKNNVKKASPKEYRTRIIEKAKAVAFIKSANRKSYGKLLSSIREQHSFKIDVYPKTLSDAYEMLSSHTIHTNPTKSRKDNRTNTTSEQSNVRSGGDSGLGRSDTSYLQTDIVAGTDGRTIEHITCYSCGKKGHYADNCPEGSNGNESNEQHVQTASQNRQNINESDESDEQMLQVEDDDYIVHFSWTQMAQTVGNKYNETDILLDTGSTFSVFKNHQMLLNIRDGKKTLKAYTNGGRQDSTKVGDLPGFFTVWYNPNSMINILSWADVSRKFRITADTAMGKYITVHLSDTRKMIFEEVGSGLYLFRNPGIQSTLNKVSGYSYLMLTESKLSDFNKGEIQGAQNARDLHRSLGFPGYAKYMWLLRNQKIQGCTVTVEDAKRALHLYGEEVATVKGRTTKQRQSKIHQLQHTSIPNGILTKHRKVHLMVDYMFVQGIQFLTTISNKFNYRTVEALPYSYKKGAKKDDILSGINKVIKLYEARGLTVEQVNGDNEFECIREEIRPIMLNISAADEHVSPVERSIRAIKERTRCQVQYLPYAKYPRNMVIGCVIFATKTLNNEIGMSCLSKQYSPNALVTGRPTTSYDKLVSMTFGEYAEVYADNNVTNTNEERTTSTIGLYPSGNLQGGWIFMSLNTGRVLHRKQWKKLPITNKIIHRVEEMAEKENQPYIATNFKYRWSNGAVTQPQSDDNSVDNDDDSIQTNVDESNTTSIIEFHEIADDVNEIEMEIEEVDSPNTNEDEGAATDSESEVIPDHVGSEPVPPEHNEVEVEEQVHDDEESHGESVSNHNVIDGIDENNMIEPSASDDLVEAEAETDEGTTATTEQTDQKGYNLRSRNTVDYRALHKYGETQLMQLQQDWVQEKQQSKGTTTNKVNKVNIQSKDLFRKMVGIIMTQMSKLDKHAQVSVNEGVKRYGEKAIAAILKEFTQLNDKQVFKPCNPNRLSAATKRKALNLITMIKQKRDGKIKGRACADGRKQRRYITKEQVSSPTVQLESLMLSLLIDAHENRDVATADVVGAYLLAIMNDYIIVKISGTTANIMCQVNPQYKDFIVNEKGKPTLYLQLSKALYGCMQSALLWYETFKTCLESLGFELNKYDPCVANKMINGKQCTICWYVDDTKISHVDKNVVDWVINQLEDKFGKMTVTRGTKHTFVGVDIEFLKNGTVQLSMDDYVQECIDKYKDEVRQKATTPAKGDLFDDDEGDLSELLAEDEAEKFHHTTAKLLFLSKRVRIDIDLAVSFLCTRVAAPTKGDREKLIRVLSYLNGTKRMKRIMGANGLDYLQSWTDASYAIHRDMKGHTGGVISMGKGAVIHNCSKQKLNTKSSTESEVVGVSDFLPYTMWASYFLGAQGYKLYRNIFYQDNTSAIKMIKNGKSSCGSKSRHIHIRYFFTKDALERENIDVHHCASDNMVADFYTKPLQGKQFYHFRNLIMGHNTMPAEERVEERTTVHHMDPTVSKKKGRTTYGYKISNNFN